MSLDMNYIIDKYGDDTISLKTVNESNKELTEVKDIGGCKSLNRLELAKNKLTDIEEVTKCYELTYLNLSNNLISKLSGYNLII